MVTCYFLFDLITGNESLKIAFVTRETIYLCSSKTKYEWVNVSDKFYDTESEKINTVAMTEDEFDATIIKTFANQGYRFVKKHL